MPSTLKSTLPKIPPWRAEARYTPFRQLVFLKRNIHMRVIKEHKEIILKYLMSALDYSYIDNKNFIIEYKLIVDQMNNICYYDHDYCVYYVHGNWYIVCC